MKIILSILLIGVVYVVGAQSDVDNYFTDKSEAMTYASLNEGKILMVFGGSDWCRPCMKFKKEVLDNDQFKSYAKEKLAVLYLDFPARKKNKLSKVQTKHNEELAEKFNKSGAFPKILLMDKGLNKIKEVAYSGQKGQNFISTIN